MATTTSGLSGYHPQQKFLFDVQPEVLAIWQQELQDRIAHEAVLSQRKVDRTQKRITFFIQQANQQGIHWINEERFLQILENPLGVYIPTELDVQQATEPEDVDQDEEKIVWSEQAIRDLHEGVLMYSLSLLNSKGNAKEKRDTLEWIFADDVYDLVERTVRGQIKRCPVRTDQIPFSFQTCCRLVGYRYDELRAGLAWTCKDKLKELGFVPRNI